MGAWGEEPLENDAALDALGPVFDMLVEIVETGGREEKLGAAEVLIRTDDLGILEEDALEGLFNTINAEMRRSVLSRWRDPDARRTVLMRMADAVDREGRKKGFR